MWVRLPRRERQYRPTERNTNAYYSPIRQRHTS
nr:MAG TPA: hypothetical protein [Caudoviricetes sp.]